MAKIIRTITWDRPNKIELFFLRLKKFFITRVVFFAYRDLPFDIFYTNLDELVEGVRGYEPPKGKILAKFDVPFKNRKYVIISKYD